jgi:hypothetical protein
VLHFRGGGLFLRVDLPGKYNKHPLLNQSLTFFIDLSIRIEGMEVIEL